MNQSLEALVGSIRRALHEEILPELESDHARSQLAGVLDVLGKVESMVVWSPDVAREQLVLLETCIAQSMTRLAAAGYTPPHGIAATKTVAPATYGALQIALADTERRFALLTDWLFSPPSGLSMSCREALHDLLSTALRNTLKAQRRLVASADFSSMTAPRHLAGTQGDSQ